MSQANVSTFQLALAGLTPNLGHYLKNLADAGTANGVPLCFETSADIDRHTAVSADVALRNSISALSGSKEAKVLDIDDLSNREAVMHFGKIDVLWRKPGLMIRFRSGALGGRESRCQEEF